MALRRRLLEIEEAMAAPERTAQGLVLVTAGRENEELAIPAPLNESCARDETKEIECLRRRHVQNDELPTRFDDGAAETNLLSTPRDRSGASLAPLLAPNHTLSEFTQRDDEDAVVGMRRQSSATMTRFVEARYWNQVTGAAILPAGIGDDISAGLQQSAVEPAGDHLVVDDDDDARL
ncbi:Hypothetical protein, putative [Bodo saltans]|uniref:Uncharacterized protein n=1 Tax=Bodo saltans TaxID=75058 RepID=A0A0S4ITE5_BODSA|nr:Hypothetical protein, putative [Bodo saltans]|eukprot:CUF76639.1 Hypothetical protein, putative [Bodo saltans]